MCGAEGNLYGMLIGREYLKDPILYTSKDSHLSIFKASKFFRIEMEIVNTLKNGEIDYTEFDKLLKKNKNRSALINLNIGTSYTL
jgi:histidine decarboxylase